MLGELQAEEIRAEVNALLITNNRSVRDDEHQRFMRSIAPRRRHHGRAPKASPALLARLGINLNPRKGGENT